MNKCIFSCMHYCTSVGVCERTCTCTCVRRFEICASLLCLSSKGFSPDNVMSGCVSSTNPGLDSNISSQSETPSSLCCVPSFHIQQHKSQSAAFPGLLHKDPPTPFNTLTYCKFCMSDLWHAFRNRSAHTQSLGRKGLSEATSSSPGCEEPQLRCKHITLLSLYHCRSVTHTL